MLIDFRRSEAKPALDIDFCIIGAGVTGIGLARRLMGHGKRIVLLESGGADYEADTSELNAGVNRGLPYYALEDARLRLFGGTASIWGGRCVELDAIDFEPRAWVRYSGWPFSKSALHSHYDAARKLLGVEEAGSSEDPKVQLGIDSLHLGDGVLSTELWQFDDAWDRFGFTQNKDLIEHPDVTVYLHATVLALHLNAEGGAIKSVEVASLSGHRARLCAKVFVLAAGGIENPRILLASRGRDSKGIGNAHDVVGRYFMEHPHARGGRLHVLDLWRTLRAFRSSHWVSGNRYAASLRVDDRLQRAERILNSSFTPRVRPHTGGKRAAVERLYQTIKEQAAPTRNARGARHLARSAPRSAKRLSDPLAPWLALRTRGKGIYLAVRAEQAPNPSSRVHLIDDQDALGMPRVALDWRLSDIDKRTIQVLVKKLDAQMRDSRLGHVDPAPWLTQPDVLWEHDELVSLHAIGGYHHMGTTRMANDPRFGVVDANCRVHDILNLYVAGSSVFPTSGWANPTLTSLALALRLADHLLNMISYVGCVADEKGRAKPDESHRLLAQEK